MAIGAVGGVATVAATVAKATGIFTIFERVFGTVTKAAMALIAGTMPQAEFDATMTKILEALAPVDVALDALDVKQTDKEQRIDDKFDRVLKQTE